MMCDFTVALFAVGMLFVGLLWGISCQHDIFNNTAVKAGVAEYYLDENHEKQFRFKECNPQEQEKISHD